MQVSSALYGFRLGCFAKALKSRCKSDKAAYISSLADSVQMESNQAFAAVNALLCRRRKKPFAPAVLPSVLEKDGTPCASPDAAKRRWRQHFSALEDGVESSAEGLICTAASKQSREWPVPDSLHVIPTPADLQKALLSAQRGKACGPDMLPGELGIGCSYEMQRIVYPLVLKLGLLGEEAIGHKGGTLTWLYKGRGAQTDCSAFRGILLLSHICKAVHRTFRPRIQEHFEVHARELQLSGKKGGTVTFGSHVVRTFLRLCVSRHRSAAVVFADVASAYYSARRELAVRHPSDAAHGQRASQEGFETDCLEEQLALPSALEQEGASGWLKALTTVINEDTWMCLQNDDTPVQTRRGTRAGSAWADLTFARILKVKASFQSSPQVQSGSAQVQWDGRRDWTTPESPSTSVPLSELIWADDLAACVEADLASDLPRAVGVEVGALDDAFQCHGFDLSYGPRKTAAILCPRGKGSREVRRRIFQKDPSIPMLREHAGASVLPVVDSYRHLGVIHMHDGGMRQEIRQRCALAWTAFREGRSRVFRCRRVAVARRGVSLDTLVISKLRFGCGAWPPLGCAEGRLFGGTLFSLYRATLGLSHRDDQHISLATCCALLCLLDHDSLLKVEQLRYLRQLVAHAPDVLWALLRQDTGYLRLLRDALEWLYARVGATSNLPHPLENVEPWCEVCRSRPGLFKGLVKRAKGLSCAGFDAMHRCRRFIAPSASSAMGMMPSCHRASLLSRRLAWFVERASKADRLGPVMPRSCMDID